MVDDEGKGGLHLSNFISSVFVQTGMKARGFETESHVERWIFGNRFFDNGVGLVVMHRAVG